MHQAIETPVVHLELHTPNMQGARAFYRELLRWRSDRIEVGAGAYQALTLGDSLGGGIVECRTDHGTWLPYVEVDDIEIVTGQARSLGAAVLLEAREGPMGWRSVVATSDGGEIALWEPKRKPGERPE